MLRPFTDEAFMKFVGMLDARREQLRQTLQQWQSADLQAVAQRPLHYLPLEASIRADVYPVIKPQSNSFVVEAATAPAIFLYLDKRAHHEDVSDTDWQPPADGDLIHFYGTPAAEPDPSLQSRWLHRPNRQ